MLTLTSTNTINNGGGWLKRLPCLIILELMGYKKCYFGPLWLWYLAAWMKFGHSGVNYGTVPVKLLRQNTRIAV
jgi:hypothetical protein